MIYKSEKTIDKLDRYAQLKIELSEIKNEIAQVEAELREQVGKSGEVAGFGFRAYLKPGRKSIDHQAAVDAAILEYNRHKMHSLANEAIALVEKYSTVKTTVQWAKVTKEMGLKLDKFTTEGATEFVIEAIG